MLLKHRQDGFVGEDNLYVHDADIARALLTDSFGETASTSKIVNDAGRDLQMDLMKRWGRCLRRPHHES